MARTTRINKEELEQARQLRDQATTAAELKKALSVILTAELNLDSNKAADILGISQRTLFRNRDEIRNQGTKTKRAWGGRRRCCMTLEQEREFLAQWEPSAITGGVISVPPLHAALVQRLGYDVPVSTTYRLLARHGWRKVQPDTKHPKSDPVSQDEFKKNCPRSWRPPA
jgi:transposase